MKPSGRGLFNGRSKGVDLSQFVIGSNSVFVKQHD